MMKRRHAQREQMARLPDEFRRAHPAVERRDDGARQRLAGAVRLLHERVHLVDVARLRWLQHPRHLLVVIGKVRDGHRDARDGGGGVLL